jgi:eukaryotic-like serine/threonine-protein kinase
MSIVITPERWRQIEGLYHSALQHGPGVLAGADPELRSEVEKLLAQDSEGKILDRPASELLEAFTAAERAAGGPFDLAGQTISHYRIQEKLGAGGMGVVYKAFDTKLNRLVALKFLSPHLSHDAALRRQLSEEARAASALDHPNIVVIYDIDETSRGDVFIAMAFHEGETLQTRIRRIEDGVPMPVAEALNIARQVASGLARAHERGIFHRDIKPGNVVVAKDGIARIIDFGLAKSTETTATVDGSARGTPLYMSPEQVSGKPLDHRTDLWSLGVVLYEMLAGRPPFPGDRQLQVMQAIVNNPYTGLRDIRPDLPPQVELILSRALEKEAANRYQSAAQMAGDLSAALAALEAPVTKRPWRKPVYVIPALALILMLAGLSVWLYRRSENRHWARERAIPEIARLTGANKPVAAFLLVREAQKYLAADPQLAQIAKDLTHAVSVKSSPSGALVEIKDYLSPGDAWFPLGTTPLKNVQLPNGYLRWRVSKAGVGEYVGAPVAEDVHGFFPEFKFPLDALAGPPAGMVAVPATRFDDYNYSVGELGPYDLPAFYIDRFEVTNRQYQEFVDRGGYQKREYWKESFIRDGKELGWQQAMDLFRDSTGRPGPSTWEAGHYPDGRAEYPVGGVSWYEAAAYAEFAGKSLPVIAQWYLAAPSSVAKYVIQRSNYSLSAPSPAGEYQGVGPWGTYDMAGNVAEWCWNKADSSNRYLLGGAWNTSSAEYFEAGGASPLSRTASNGFRCVRNTARLPAEATAERNQMARDLANAQPATDETFKIYKSFYAYDRTALHVKVEATQQDSKDWRKEKITFNAAYGKERIPAYLFLPVNVRPPYQTVLFFPSARVLGIPTSEKLGDMKFVDYVIRSGRAVMYPVYQGTYERPGSDSAPSTAASRDALVHQSQDLERSLDYLETRTDIDREHFGYLGVSMGAAQGVIFTALEGRFKAVIFLDGGFSDERPFPGTDQIDFAPRLKAPVLMISGKYDWVFGGKDVLFRMLGTPAANKRVVTLETAHDVSEQRADLVQEVTAWLDKYLGKVD